MKSIAFSLALMILLVGCDTAETTFKINSDSVQEADYKSRAITPTQLISDYPMETDLSIAQPILFKLSLNGKDNEAGFGKDHHLVIPKGVTEFFAPTMKFGVQTVKPPGVSTSIESTTNVHFRVDLRPVLESFKETDQYISPTNDTIRAEDFKGLYIAGGTEPLHWIWDMPAAPEHLRFHDSDQDSIYELSLTFTPPTLDTNPREWSLKEDISHLPKFTSPKAPLLEALTNLALEEALLNIREDGAFSAGKEWHGIWTRDISYAAQLSLAYLFPENMKTSLRAKLSNSGRIIQDTGTGGSWPVSSDRHVWTLAAWEVFLATGDEDWLDEIRAPVLQALQEDLLWNRDPVSGMLQGETSFEDWRDQTYPIWMSPANIHSSHALSTNIIFKKALEIGLVLADGNMDIIRSWPPLIQRLDQSIYRHFWNPSLNAPASYIMTTPAWIPAPHRDILGESLAILWSHSFSQLDSQLVATYPRTPYGTPIISRQLPHAPPYHNKGIWPFVEAYGLLAAKQAGNAEAYKHGFYSLIRSAGLFLSHRENFEYNSGRPDNTEINSDRQLWSVAGWLGAIYKGLFGIAINYDFDTQGFALQLQPDNPFSWDEFTLTNLNLHDTPIAITIHGSGARVESMTVNGVEQSPEQTIQLNGELLEIVVELVERRAETKPSIVMDDILLPEMPVMNWSNDTLSWASASEISILELNGQFLDTLRQPTIIISDSLSGFFTLRSIDARGLMSMPTQPHYLGPSATLMLSPKEPYFIELGNENTFIDMNFTIPTAGNYLIRFIYSNGSGPINTGNTCGLAKLVINDWWLEQMISFPHTNSWDNLSTTAWAKASFKAGNNVLILNQESLPTSNMNGEVNVFRVLSVEIIPI